MSDKLRFRALGAEFCASETARFFVVSNIFHQPFGIAPEGLFFAVGPLGPAAFFISLSRGRVAAGVQQKTKKGARYGQQKYESRHRQNADSGVMNFQGRDPVGGVIYCFYPIVFEVMC